jgi:hypothetical protein
MAGGGREEYNRPVTSGVEQETPRPGGVFVGRERELAELTAGLLTSLLRGPENEASWF